MIFWIFFEFSKVLKIVDYKIYCSHWSIPKHQEQTNQSSKLKTYSFHIFQYFSEGSLFKKTDLLLIYKC